MILGEERLFITEDPHIPSGIMESFLKFMGRDQNGLKMKGNFPKAWTIEAGKVYGPLLFDEDNVYEVTLVDYDRIRVKYHLKVHPEKVPEAKAAISSYLQYCPAAQSIKGCIEIKDELILEHI